MESLGYITIEDVANVWVEGMNKLDKEIWPDAGSASRAAVLAHFESLKYELYKRAKGEVPHDRPRRDTRPGLKRSDAPLHESPSASDEPPSNNYEERWRAATRMGRMYAMEKSGD